MCLSPVYINNPNRHYTKNPFSNLYDSISQKIAVPCGRCPVCIALRQNYLVQRVQMECLDNLLFFGTLTYNNETLPSVTVNGYDIKYANIRHVQDMMRYIRKHEKLHFRYMVVSEFGGKRHRPHFHFLLFIPKSIFNKPYIQIDTVDLQSMRVYLHEVFLKYWRHNIGSRKFPIWVQNCTYKCIGYKRNYDLDFVDTISSSPDDVTFYVSKYVCKFDSYVDKLKSALFFNLPEAEFKETWNTVRPRFLYSKGFGNPHSEHVKEYIIDCIERGIRNTDFPYPCYFSPTTGQSFPLSPYYRRRFVSFENELIFKERMLQLSPTGVAGDKELDEFPDLVKRKFDRFEVVKQQIASRDFDNNMLFHDPDFNINTFLANYGHNIYFENSSEDFDISDFWEDS